jgi:hypothetical protein
MKNRHILEKLRDLNASGYAGILPSGMIVDRREHPSAIPIQEKMFGIVKPKPLPFDKKSPDFSRLTLELMYSN